MVGMNRRNHRSMLIDEGSKEQLKATGYKRNYLKTVLFHFISVSCICLPYVLVYWHDVFGIRWQYVQCSISQAQVVILEDIHGQTYIAKVHEQPVGLFFPEEYSLSHYDRPQNKGSNERSNLQNTPFARYFIHQHVKYMWSKKYERFQMLTGIERGIQLCHFYYFKGYPGHIQETKLALHGYNTMAIDVKSYWRILIDEVLNPFYLFEVFSMVVWTADDYLYYAGCIFVVSVISLAVALYEIRKQSETLKKMTADHVSTMVTVSRGGDVYEKVYAVRLVPGDVIAIPPTGSLMACDAVLISGTCIVSESLLTGESAPETKTPVPDLNESYCTDIHKRHTLFCGTKVLQTRFCGQNKVLAVVIRTGFTTAKGELIRSILYPKPIGFKFYIDSIKFVLILFCVAVCGIIYSVYVYISKGATVTEIVIRACDMLTIVVHPAMPAAMTVGTVYSQARLRKHGIFCISPPLINVCGKLKLMCFDKTGTLTEGGLEFFGVAPRLDDNIFGDLVLNPSHMLKQDNPLLVTMAACHTLNRVEGQLIGDPLELEMFKATHWVLEEPGADFTRYDVMAPIVVKPMNRDTFLRVCGIDFAETGCELPYSIGIIRQLPFSSSLQRMSVVVRALGSSYMELLCKGSPEKIRSLCVEQSVPADFSAVLRRHTIRGFRVLALAHRVLDRRLTWHQMHRMKREQIECDLQFLGLLIMKNTLKIETTPVIRQLRTANINCVMVTGDNLLTAVNVARDCEMLPLGERVILVTASPPVGDDPASIKYSLAEMYEAESESVDPSAPDFNFSDSGQVDPMLTDSWPESVFWSAEDGSGLHGSRQMLSPGGGGGGGGGGADLTESKMHFALSGSTLDIIRKFCPELLPKILCRGTVFARMSPDQKTKIVEEYQSLGYVVGMCGDGANDCGALKAAHVGVSLSDTEASVAAPFTARSGNISCVPTIIREGRCALVTSYGTFKYMALYSLIQCISVLILYSMRTTLGDFMFLYHDLIITTTVAVLIGKTDPYPELVVNRPKGSLLTTSNLLSITMQVALTAAIQLGALLLLMLQPWYIAVQPHGDEVIIPCWEVTVVFCISSFQYLIIALAFSYGPPYRQPVYTNVLFMLALLALACFSLVLVLLPVGPLADFFQVMGVDLKPFFRDSSNEGSGDGGNCYFFRACILLLVVVNVVVSFFIELLVVENDYHYKEPVHLNRRPKNRYKIVQLMIDMDRNWPPVRRSGTEEILDV